jgi:hypothetical protein
MLLQPEGAGVPQRVAMLPSVDVLSMTTTGISISRASAREE